MKNVLLVLFASVLLFSCENEKDVQSDIDKLRETRTTLSKEVREYSSQVSSMKQSTISLNKQITDKSKELLILKEGRQPRYILSLRLKQSRFSLDLGKHAKDAMNAIEFDLPVDKQLYDQVRVGTELVDDFRSGSFIMNGSFSSWKIKVKNKRIQ